MNFQDTPLFFRMLGATPFSAHELALTLITAPNRYKDHFIKKRNGRGLRLISQPTAEVKHLQRIALLTELKDLPVHGSAVGYKVGHSIKNHAAPHANANYLLKLDFKDFFPSLKLSSLLHCLQRDTKFSESELWILGQLLCRHDRKSGTLGLSIGAPSSPFISNYLMFEFDTLISKFCSESNVSYTRYADDLAFSTSVPHLLDYVQQEVLRLIASIDYLSIILNETKTVNVSKKNRRTLVGLNLSNSGTASIGREAKRVLRATLNSFSKGDLKAAEISRLRGQLAFVQSIDPDFVAKICARHGISKVSEITHMHLVT